MKFLAMLALATLLIACGKKETIMVIEKSAHDQSNQAEAAPLLSGHTDETTGETYVVIPKTYLEREVLMTSALISGTPAPAGNALASKVVTFKKQAGHVVLFESPKGKLTTATLPTKILLTEFKIVNETEDSLTFDFKDGMSQLFVQRALHSSEGKTTTPGPTETAVQVLKTYIEKIEQRGKYIFIDQYARTGESNGRNKMAQVKYTFSLYEPDTTFKAKESSLLDKVGFFELAPLLDPHASTAEKQSLVYILRFHPKKQITYHLSSNIPQVYQQAVKDGVLYWNKVFGKEVLKVAQLPAHISVHEPHYNILQWLEWDTAGFAYADMQSDPRTGQILQSHVYMTSVFGKGGLKRAKAFLKKLLADQSPSVLSREALALKGFESAHICHLEYRQALSNGISQLLKETADLPDEEAEVIYQRYANDYIREVVAHEVGHTLGLRHNFSGSIGSNIRAEDFHNVARTYFLTGTLPAGQVPGTTVMDYTPSMLAAMHGAHIRHALAEDSELAQKYPPFSYDKKAISWGYSEEDLDAFDFPTFCTDGDRAKGTYHDCKVWDKLSRPIANAVMEWRELATERPFSLLMKFDEAVEKGGDLEKLKKVFVDPVKAVEDDLKVFQALLEMTGKKAQFMVVRENYPSKLSPIDQTDYQKQLHSFRQESFEKLGGLTPALLKDLVPTDGGTLPFITAMRANFERFLQSLYGVKLSDEQLDYLKKRSHKYFDLYQQQLLEGLAKKLYSAKLDLKDKTFFETLGELVEKTLFAKSDKLLATTSAGVKVLSPLYQDDVRAALAKLMTADFYPDSPSMSRNKKEVLKELYLAHTEELKTILGDSSADDLSNDQLFDFVTKEKALFKPFKAAAATAKKTTSK